MTLDDRQEIVVTVQAIYALMGRVIGTHVPEAVLQRSVQPDAVQEFVDLEIDWRVTDERMRELLTVAYAELEQNVLQLQDELLQSGEVGERYDSELGRVGLTGSGWQAKWYGFSTAVASLLGRRSTPGIKKVFRWANVILGSLSGVPGVGVVVEPLRELKEAIEADGEGDESPPEQAPLPPDDVGDASPQPPEPPAVDHGASEPEGEREIPPELRAARRILWAKTKEESDDHD